MTRTTTTTHTPHHPGRTHPATTSDHPVLAVAPRRVTPVLAFLLAFLLACGAAGAAGDGGVAAHAAGVAAPAGTVLARHSTDQDDMTASTERGAGAHLTSRPRLAGFIRSHPTHQPPATRRVPARVTTALTGAQALRLTLKAVPGLVNITTALPGGGGEAGTGIVLRHTGLVLTAGHVVTGATDVQALDLGDGHTYPATVIGIDHRHDIALLQLVGATDLPTARIGDSDTLHLSEPVISIGDAYGRGYPSVGIGSVTALHQPITTPDRTPDGVTSTRHLTGLIEADSGIVPGQSGGPMIDRRGTVIGVNDAFRMTASGTPTPTGYAVPINTALRAAHALLAHHTHDDLAPTP